MAGEQRFRLLGFERLELQPGETRRAAITAEARLLARFGGPVGITGNWRIAEGARRVVVGASASEFMLTADTPLKARQFGS